MWSPPVVVSASSSRSYRAADGRSGLSGTRPRQHVQLSLGSPAFRQFRRPRGWISPPAAGCAAARRRTVSHLRHHEGRQRTGIGIEEFVSPPSPPQQPFDKSAGSLKFWECAVLPARADADGVLPSEQVQRTTSVYGLPVGRGSRGGRCYWR